MLTDDISISRSACEDLIDEWVVGRNAERNRLIMKRRLIDGVTFDALAEEFDMSTRQMKNIVHRLEHIISKHI